MKTINRHAPVLCIIAAIGIMIFASCSKDRTEKTTNTDYASLDAFYLDNAPPEQTFIIDSLGNDTIVGMDSTIIWGIPKTIFMDSITHLDINYPYTLKLIEAYSIKNMILSKLPNLAQGNVLASAGELRVRAFKNSSKLVLKNNCGLNMWNPDPTPDASMKVFYGFTQGTTDDWNMDVTQTDYLYSSDAVTSISTLGQGYHSVISKLGWVSIDHTFAYTNANITFTATGNNTNFIDVYVIFKDRHSYVKVSNLAASNLPSGEPITVFAIAMDTGGTMYYFKQDYIISNGLVIDLLMSSSTEIQVLSMMDGL